MFKPQESYKATLLNEKNKHNILDFDIYKKLYIVKFSK